MKTVPKSDYDALLRMLRVKEEQMRSLRTDITAGDIQAAREALERLYACVTRMVDGMLPLVADLRDLFEEYGLIEEVK